jgi:tight adherence protein B
VSTVSELANRATLVAEQVLDRRGRRNSLNEALERAGLALRPGEFLVLAACAALTAMAAGTVVAGFWLGILFAGLSAVGCRVALGILAGRRRSQFSDQLGDTLQLLAGSLRAGYGLLQAVDSVAAEAGRPTRDEFRRIVVETRLGRDLGESLHAAAERVGGEDFEWVVQAIDIHRQVGGDLAQVLDNVASTIRERNQVRRQVKALTAEGRISAYILLALPIFLAFAIRLINPSYFSALTYGLGLVMSIAGLVMMALGALWMRKLCRLEY